MTFSQVMKKELTSNFIYSFVDGSKEANLYKIKSPRLCSQKVVIGIDIDNIGDLEDLLRVVFIDEECGNLKVVVHSTSSADFHSVKNAVDEGIL